MNSFEEAVTLHDRGVRGDAAAVREAYRRLSQLRSSGQGNAVLEAYYGSTLTLLARDESDLLEKADKAAQGLQALDRAAAMNAHDLTVRLIRAMVIVRLPQELFPRAATAVNDLTYVLDRYKKDPSILSDTVAAQARQDLNLARKLVKNIGRK